MQDDIKVMGETCALQSIKHCAIHDCSSVWSTRGRHRHCNVFWRSVRQAQAFRGSTQQRQPNTPLDTHLRSDHLRVHTQCLFSSLAHRHVKGAPQRHSNPHLEPRLQHRCAQLAQQDASGAEHACHLFDPRNKAMDTTHQGLKDMPKDDERKK
eukprot:1136942-Pelagomonas_calceolata.AAC.2